MPSKLSLGILSSIFLVVLLCGSVSASLTDLFGDRSIKGSGHLETHEFNLADLNAVSIHGAFDLNVRMGKKQQISVTIDDNLWENLEIKVTNGVLVMDWEESCRPDSDCSIDLVLPHLKEVSVHGACDAEIDDFKGESFCFDVHGAADLQIDGEVEELEIKISGAGDVDAKDLKASHVKVRISGAGNATVFAEKSINARISGVGNLTYYGNPEDENTNVSGIGSIKKK